MGCASSKNFKEQTSREYWSAPLPRSMSMPVYHRAEREGDSYHMVALTSSSYGVLTVDSHDEQNGGSFVGLCWKEEDTDDLSSLSATKLINSVKLKPVKEEEKLSDFETINTWELMEGLESGLTPSPLKRALSPVLAGSIKKRSLDRSASFHAVQDIDVHYASMGSSANSLRRKYHKSVGKENINPEDESSYPMPFNEQNFNPASPSTVDKKAKVSGLNDMEESISPLDKFQQCNSPLFDPAIMATFEKAVDSLSTNEWVAASESTSSAFFSLEYAISSSDLSSDADSYQSQSTADAEKVMKQTALEHFSEQKLDKHHSTKCGFSKITPLDCEEECKRLKFLQSFDLKCPPGGEGKVVLYFTSLRGIRKTYEDCCEMKLILQGTKVHVDERDVWMHSKFKQELTDLLGKVSTVPRLFIKGRYIGGAEEVKRLHEEGIFAKLLDGLPTQDSKEICDGCGDVRFVPCLTCRGSCKVKIEDSRVSRCLDCNENGLIMCPLCSS